MLTTKKKLIRHPVVPEKLGSLPNSGMLQNRKEERGIILLVLLWTMALMALIALNLASAVRTEIDIARTTLDSEQAYFFARGAIEEALYGLVFPDKDKDKQSARFPYRGGMNHFRATSGDWSAHVAILDEAGKLNLNFCEQPVLQKLLEELGNDEAKSSQLATAILEWRKPLSSPDNSSDASGSALGPDAAKMKHRPFDQVEELLLVPGMSREILYGTPGDKSAYEELSITRHRRGLADFVTVFTGKNQVNPNYAELEVLAILPGMDSQKAQTLIDSREQPYKSTAEIGERTGLLLEGELLSLLNPQPSQYFSLIGTGMLKGSPIRRSVRLVAKIQSTGTLLPGERISWMDEYWAPPQLLKWLEKGVAEESSAGKDQ
jgi:general secretion pathway protein K